MSATPEHPSMSEQDAGPAIPEVDYEVRVTLTIAIPYHGAYPALSEAMTRVCRAISVGGTGILPEGTHYCGDVVVCVRTAKEIRADDKRAEAKRLRALSGSRA